METEMKHNMKVIEKEANDKIVQVERKIAVNNLNLNNTIIG